VIDLNASIGAADDLLWELDYADDINNAGQIVGYGLFDDDCPSGIDTAQVHAFRLDPIPEPTILGIAASAAVMLTRPRRTSRRSWVAPRRAAADHWPRL
jgi:hypothetical protein